MVLPEDIVRAGVIADGVDTRYVGAGRGFPVIILSEDAERRGALVALLPRDLRAIAPESIPVSHDGAELRDFPVWLAGFLDALGIMRVAVVADASLAAPAVGVALAFPTRITSLALLQLGSCNNECLGHAGGDPHSDHQSDGTPLLLTWIGTGDTAAMARAATQIAQFCFQCVR